MVMKSMKHGLKQNDNKGGSHVDNDENTDIGDILPEDGVSNVAIKQSSRQSSGSRKSCSSTASARIKAEAVRAALVARAAAMKRDTYAGGTGTTAK